MSYHGTVTIVDSAGNAVFERELGTDELIEELLKPKEESGPVDATMAKVVDTVLRSKSFSKTAESDARDCDCKQKNHKKSCVHHVPKSKRGKASKADEIDDDENIGRTAPLSRSEFQTVITSREHGMMSPEIADNMSAEVKEVRAAFKSATYEGYMERRNKPI